MISYVPGYNMRSIGVMMTGRPTRLNERITKLVCEGLRLGMKKNHALKRAGLPRSTFCAWVNRGKQGIQPYKDFWSRVEKAEADGIAYNLGLIHKAAKEQRSWQAAAWILERCHGYYRNVPEVEENEIVDSEELDVKDLLDQIQKSTQELKPYLEPEIED